MRKLIDNIYLFWLLLAVPAIVFAALLLSGTEPEPGLSMVEALLSPTGEFSARFMIAAMLISPLRAAFPRAMWLLWFAQRRRALGVAAFGYAVLHLVLYLVFAGDLAVVLDEFWVIGILTGWVAFALFIPLAITSNDYYQRRLRTGWKRLQRLVYPAAIATVLHWFYVHNGLVPMLIHFAPLALLECVRIGKAMQKRRAAAARRTSPTTPS